MWGLHECMQVLSNTAGARAMKKQTRSGTGLPLLQVCVRLIGAMTGSMRHTAAISVLCFCWRDRCNRRKRAPRGMHVDGMHGARMGAQHRWAITPQYTEQS